MTFVVGLNKLMITKGHGVMRDRCDLLNDQNVTLSFVVSLT